MKARVTTLPQLALLLLVFLSPGSITSCDYARMREQESVRTYEKEMPRPDSRTVPVHNGYQALRAADPKMLKNPRAADPGSINRGKKAYTYFCIQCHGEKLDGMGTVGQSFSPLPTDLLSARVQGQGDGELYMKIRLGFKRHPELYTTISEPDTWAVINYSRHLAGNK